MQKSRLASMAGAVALALATWSAAAGDRAGATADSAAIVHADALLAEAAAIRDLAQQLVAASP